MPKEPIAFEPRAQIAALPWRSAGDAIEVLMITSRQSRHWLIPKGWPMKGKSRWAAAAQEAREEAGIEGTTAKVAIGAYEYDKLQPDGSAIRCRVEVFPLLVSREKEGWKEETARERRWMDLDTAAGLAFEPGLAELLDRLDPQRLLVLSPPKKAKRRT